MLEFRTLGASILASHGKASPNAPAAMQPKRLALLAYLVLAHPRGFHRRDTLLAIFWPELDTRHARNALSQALYSLRTALGDGAILTRGNEAIAVLAGALRCDAITFEEHLDAGLPADAMELYGGELLAGLYAADAPGFERWLDAERRRFRRRAKDATVAVAEREEQSGNILAAARWLERGFEISPTDETLVRWLIRLLDEAGDRAGALTAYERFARHLEIEFETEPSPETQAAIEAVRERRRVTSRDPSIDVNRVPGLAVLPLENLSGNPDQDYFAEGMTETLITELARLKGLRVISRQSTSSFKGMKRPLSEIVRRLDVDLVLEGSVLHAGDRVRIAAQLLRAEPETHVWADAFDGPSKDVLGLQREVARAIAREVGGLFGHRPAAPADYAHPVDPQAYDEFLRGVVRFPYTTAATFDEVVGYFERAGELDEAFAEAHAWIAFAWMNAAYAGARSLKQAREHALPAVERALGLAPSLGSIHAIHATALMSFVRDWAAVASAWAKAQELGGGDVRSYAAYLLFQTGMGRFDEALAFGQKGVSINPLGPPEQFSVGYVHFRARHYEMAVEQLTWTLVQWPEYPWTASFLAASQLFGGWPTKAIETCRKALASPNIPTSLAFLAATLGRAGEIEEARRIVKQLEDIDATAYLDPCPLAVAYAGLGEDAQALSALERLVEEGSIQSWSLPIEIFFDPLRSHSRFRRVIKALRLPTLPGRG